MTLHNRINCWLALRNATADFEISDNSDGRGQYISRWVSAVPQPALDELPDEAAVNAWLAEVAAQPQDVTVGRVRLRTHADGAVELIDGPLILPGSASGAYEVWVDAETGLVLSVLDHASPRKTKAEKDAAKQAKRDQIKAVKAAQTDKDKLAALLKLLGLAP